MRPTYNYDRVDTWRASNGTSPFALFRGRWGGAALRTSGRAPRNRSARAVAADSGSGEGTWIYAFREVAEGSEIKRGGEVVFERRTPYSARSPGGEATRRGGGHWQSRDSASGICRMAFLARGGSRLLSPV